jgi:hypothetical protein
LALVGCAYLALAGGTLDWHGYWSDEFHTINAVSRSWGDLVHERASKGHPPLFFLAEKAWVGPLGHSEVADRSLPMLCGLGTVLLVYVIVRREASRWAACVASVLLMLCATQLLIVQLARSYAMLQLLATAHAALIVAGGKITAWRLVMSAGLCAAAMFTHGSAMIAIPVQLAAAAVALPARWRFIVSGGAGCLAYLPFWLAFPSLDNVETHLDWVPPPTIESLLRFPAMLQFGRQIVAVPAWAQVVTVLVLVALAVGALLGSDHASFFGLQWFFAWAAAAAAGGQGIGIVGVERYFAAALVCQPIIAAQLLDWLAARRRVPCIGVGAIVGGLALTSLVLYFMFPPFTPWREMAALVETHRIAGEAVVVASPKVLATPLGHYYPGEARFTGEDPIAGTESAVGIWVLLRDPSPKVEARVLPTSARARFRRIEAHRFHRGLVVHLSDPAGQ